MPIYEYQCQECSHLFDALQKMSDEPLTDCPDCGEPALRKLMSAPNFRLKGGGWYETDFKDKDKRNLAGDAGKDSGKDSGKEKGKAAAKGSGKEAGKEGGKEVGKSADKAKSDKKPPESKKSGRGVKSAGRSSD
jgi:putative FmdB family regulatory protein